MNNPLKYIDPSGNIVEKGNDETILRAWSLFICTNPQAAYEMMKSDITFYLQWSDDMSEGLFGSTLPRQKEGDWDYYNVDISFNRMNLKADVPQEIAIVLAHEAVHALDLMLGGEEMFKRQTYMEEALAFQSSMRTADILRYKPESHFWDFELSDMFSEAKKFSDLRVDLSLGAGNTELEGQLEKAFKGTRYEKAGSMFVFPTDDYYSIMNAMVETFLGIQVAN